MDERKPWQQAAAVLPASLRAGLRALGEDRLAGAEEFRLRRGYPMTVLDRKSTRLNSSHWS